MNASGQQELGVLSGKPTEDGGALIDDFAFHKCNVSRLRASAQQWEGFHSRYGGVWRSDGERRM